MLSQAGPTWVVVHLLLESSVGLLIGVVEDVMLLLITLLLLGSRLSFLWFRLLLLSLPLRLSLTITIHLQVALIWLVVKDVTEVGGHI